MVYCEETASDVFLSESAWNILTGDDLDLEPGTAATVYDRNGDSSGAGNSISLVTNHLTGEQLAVTPAEPLRSTSLLGYRVLDDGDYARITQGLPDEWREVVAVFDVEDEEDTYFFARALFDEIVDRSGPEVALFDGWDPVVRDRYLAEKGYYFLDPAHLEPNGFSPIEYDQRDSSNFRNSWKYMPRFRVLDQADFTTTMAVFLMLFVFVSIVCFAAMVVILFTRCMTIAMTNARVYDDLRASGGLQRLPPPHGKGADLPGVLRPPVHGHPADLRLLRHDPVLQQRQLHSRRAGRPGQLRPGGPRPLSVLIWHVPLHPGPGMLRPFHPVLFPAPLTSFPFLIPSHAFFPSIYQNFSLESGSQNSYNKDESAGKIINFV